jgi:hypothetical protein
MKEKGKVREDLAELRVVEHLQDTLPPGCGADLGLIKWGFWARLPGCSSDVFMLHNE